MRPLAETIVRCVRRLSDSYGSIPPDPGLCKGLIDISLTVLSIKDADGRIVGASRIARDATERKHAQERQKLVGAVLNGGIRSFRRPTCVR